MTRRIVFVGMGAVGSVVAWHLIRAGHHPVVVARSETAALLELHGLTITTPTATETVVMDVTSDAAEVGPCDVVFAGFKAQDWPDALPLVTPLIGPRTTLVPMLNGIPWWYGHGQAGPLAGWRCASVDADGRLGAAIAPASILGCVVYMGASRQSVTHVTWNGRKRFVLGETGGERSARLARIVSMLADADLPAEATTDIRAAVWEKLLGNTTYNPISVISGATIGQMSTDPDLRAVVRAIMIEMTDVARAAGIEAHFDVDRRLDVAPFMRDFKTSMLQDLEAGRQLEMGAIVDAVVELGLRVGIATPVIAAVGALARARWRARNCGT